MLSIGSLWVVISRVINLLIWLITVVTLLITPLTTTHFSPSRGGATGVQGLETRGFWASAS